MRAAMKPLLKWLHVASAVGFVGGLAAMLLLSLTADDSSASAFAVARRAIQTLGETLGLPSLVLLMLSGMMLTMKQPSLVEARWLWGKALLGMLVSGVALLMVQPGAMRAAALAQMVLEGSMSVRTLEAAIRMERIGVAISVAASLIAIALAVWRPRLGRRAERG
jgi:hypothetical protein